jgi:hypothetical protein
MDKGRGNMKNVGLVASITIPRVLGVLLLAAGAASAQLAGTPSPVQATVRPTGLNTVGPVMVAGSDAAADAFQTGVLPSISQLLNQRLAETRSFGDSASLLDPSRLSLLTESDVRVYFIGEGAGYRNTLGFSVSGVGQAAATDRQLIFPDASSSVSTYDPARTTARAPSTPLLPGDYVDLGTVAANSVLDFFLIANGANGGTNVFSTVAARNPDLMNHVVAFALPDSPYLILGFEDLLGGGDRDFNDVLIAIDIGARNVAALTGAPEPALGLVLSAFLVVAFLRRQPAFRSGEESR